MIVELTKYMNENQPIDIILKIPNELSETITLNAFLVTSINNELYTFEGYILEEREKPFNQRILFGDSIKLIHSISKPF